MEKQITQEEITKDMEYLVKLLHEEWEHSGKTKAEITINLSDAAEVKKRMAEAITEKQKQIANDELTFQESMELSKKNFVLLRLVKKIKKVEDKINQKGFDLKFMVELDKEEYNLFSEIVRTQEV